MDLPSRFRLDNQPFVYDQVESLGSELLTFIKDVNRYFPRDSVSALKKLALKRRYVEALEKPESKAVVNLVKGSNHRMGELSLEEFDARHA